MKKTVPILLLIVLFIAAVWYSFVKEPDPVHELPPALLPPPPISEVEKPEPNIEDGMDQVEPEPVEIQPPLPEVGDSDTAIKQALVEITGAAPLAEYLVKTQAVSRMVATIDSLTARQVPPPINPVKPAGGNFATDTEGERVVMSAENFARYDGHVTLVQNVDIDALLAFYEVYSPLFQSAWEDNGGKGLFTDRLLVVIDHLLETPDIPGPVYLVKPEAFYLFEDPDLEAMTAGQKILVRMGSANAEVVKEKLRDISTKLTM
jgi:hypothetical protein